MSFQSVRKMCLKYVVLTILLSSLVFASERSASNSDSLLSKVTWDCTNNASCFDSIKNEFIHGLQQRKAFNFDGLFSIEPVGSKKPISEGRGFMSNIFAENALRIPFGNNFAMTVQRAEQYPGYLELAIVKNAKDEGKLRFIYRFML